MAEIREITIALTIAVLLFTSGSAFLFQFLGSNGATIPAGAAIENQQYYQNVNKLINQSIFNSQGNLTGNANPDKGIQAPSLQTGFIGDFLVFGGIVIGLFSYLFAIPTSLSSIYGVISNPLAVGTALTGLSSAWSLIVFSLGTAAITIVTIKLVFEVYSSLTKYRV
jgi:hypothetical protein